MAEWNWDWNQYKPLPSSLALFGLLPNAPLAGTGVPGAPAATPVLPDVPKNRPLVTGPGYNPAVVGNPKGTSLQPGLGDFGNPTPTQPPETADEKFKRQVQEALANKDFMGGLALMSKGKPPMQAPQPFHVSGTTRMGGGKDLAGAGGAYMAKALEEIIGEKYNLMAPAKRKPNERDRYDILKGRG